jgi:predicted rRNA methylase YqxC with S4 and FtsJ domains
VPGNHRAPFNALVRILERHYPDVTDAAQAIVDGRVLVDGAIVVNPKARVRRDASIRLITERPLRGRAKLTNALDAFTLDVTGVVAVGRRRGGRLHHRVARAWLQRLLR